MDYNKTLKFQTGLEILAPFYNHLKVAGHFPFEYNKIRVSESEQKCKNIIRHIRVLKTGNFQLFRKLCLGFRHY